MERVHFDRRCQEPRSAMALKLEMSFYEHIAMNAALAILGDSDTTDFNTAICDGYKFADTYLDNLYARRHP